MHGTEVITIIGGGAFVPTLCGALARRELGERLEIRLTARRADVASLVARRCGVVLRSLRPGWRIRVCTDPSDAVDGAQAIVLLARVGGSAARAHDETFPSAFGLVGDEGLGAGGFANAWRSLPFVGRVAALIRQRAPRARVLNLMAPLGITTRALLEEGLDAVGLCELPLVTERRLGAGPWDYAGLNHVGWFFRPPGHEDEGPPPGCDREVWERFAAAPLDYYYRVFDPRAGERLGVRARSGRAEELAALSGRLLASYAEAGPPDDLAALRPTPWFEEVTAPVIAASFGGAPHRGHANVMNESRLTFLPRGVVVELAAVHTATVQTRPPDAVPPRVARFLGQVALAESLAFEAARHRRKDLLAEAALALPLPVPGERVLELVAAMTQMEEPS